MESMEVIDKTFEQRALEAITKGAYLEDTEFNLDMTFSDLGLESMDFLEIIFELEEEFNVKIPTDEYMNLEEMNGYALIAHLKLIIEYSNKNPDSGSIKKALDVPGA